MKKISIIDYGCGNLLSLVRAIEFIGYEGEITSDSKKILNSTHVILPGVGSFGNAMQKLEEYNLVSAILEYAQSNKPLLGICLGMQVLFTSGNEFGFNKGLDLIKGDVIKIASTKSSKIKIPHVGWNEIYPSNEKKEWESKILDNNLVGKSFYFVHSYIGLTKNLKETIATCNYEDVTIPSVIAFKNIFGCQFHPEKSGKNGLQVLKNFCNLLI